MRKRRTTNHIEVMATNCRVVFSLVVLEREGEGARMNSLQIQMAIMMMLKYNPEARFPTHGFLDDACR